MPSKHNCVISSPSESSSGDAHSRDDGELEEDVDKDMDFSIVIPGPEANRKDLRKGLRDAQLKVSKLYKELKKVHTEKATLEALKSGTLVDTLLAYPDFENSNWDSEDCYTSPDMQMEGIRQDLRSVVPSFLHGKMNGSLSDHFIAKVDHGMQQQRSNAAERVKVMLPLLIDHALDRDTLLGFDSELKKYELLPPVFFPEGNTKDKCVFGSNILLNLALCLLRGPSALRARKEGKSVINASTVAKHWGLTSVTPGFIALVAILASDPEFVPVGESGIRYVEDFKAYKRMLYKLYNKPSIRGVIWQYNNIIFPTQPSDGESALECNDTRYNELMDCIADESEVELST
ncbi:hypothetical protein BDQ17DRAFT_1436559 [Cyathus striatus]|nr:hypothetical protein BDQ17DRAFT_1436559 [Cyathus striatus]